MTDLTAGTFGRFGDTEMGMEEESMNEQYYDEGMGMGYGPDGEDDA